MNDDLPWGCDIFIPQSFDMTVIPSGMCINNTQSAKHFVTSTDYCELTIQWNKCLCYSILSSLFLHEFKLVFTICISYGVYLGLKLNFKYIL